MFVIVPLHKLCNKSLGIFNAAEVFRIDNPALHRREYAFGEGVVVARVRPAVARHHVQLLEQRLQILAPHGLAIVRMHKQFCRA